MVSTWMGDRLRVGKPSLYVASHLGQLSLPSLRDRLIEYVPAFLAGVKMGHVHLCRVAGNTEPSWHVRSSSSEVGFPRRAICLASLTL